MRLDTITTSKEKAKKFSFFPNDEVMPSPINLSTIVIPAILRQDQDVEAMRETTIVANALDSRFRGNDTTT